MHPSYRGLFRRGAPYLALALCLLGGLAGCDSSRAEALPEWTPADHDNQESPAAGQVDTSKKRAGMPDLEKHGINDVVLATWKQNCVRCHGVIGRGDGPDGRVLHPPDLTNPQWQRVAIDSEIRHTIKNGRGRMPAFGHLPDETVDGLVQLLRMLAPKSDHGAPPNPHGSERPAPPNPHGSASGPANPHGPEAATQPSATQPSAEQPSTPQPGGPNAPQPPGAGLPPGHP